MIDLDYVLPCDVKLAPATTITKGCTLRTLLAALKVRESPDCGQLIPDNRDADWLLDLLTNGQPHREVYRGQDGGWYVTYGGGEVSASVVSELVRRGAIASVYSNCPADAYHVGRTIDTDKTFAARKQHGKGAPTYYC